MPRRDFSGLSNPPDTGNADLNRFLFAVKENIELLCGQRGSAANHAVVKGDITQEYPPTSGTVSDLAEVVRGLMRNLKE